MSTLTKLRERLAEPPPGPFRPGFWHSPLRGPWLTSLLGTILIPAILIIALTGLISQDAYHPELGANDLAHPSTDIGPLIQFPTSFPSWTYAFTQGLHVTVGLITIPLLLAKLWSVIPKLFEWPGVRNAAHAIERLSLLLLVGGALFEFGSGVLDVENYYPWHFNFVRAHYYGAWVFFAAFLVHVVIKLPTVVRAYRTRGLMRQLRDGLPEPYEPGGLAPLAPAAPTISRRGLLATIGGASLAVLIANVGETIGGPLRRLALLAPRGGSQGSGPNDFPVNRTAAVAGVTPELAGARWRLTLTGPRTVSLTRAQLQAMPQHTHELTIGCVEGWSSTQTWTGVRLADLAVLAGARAGASMTTHSIQTIGPFGHATLSAEQVSDPRALLALSVNGVPLSPDHGYPARVIVPGAPGVHNTKWVEAMDFSA
jgi:DMSO/TMAO reductase YedYZ molybdopterin-dependent catalytic subunit